MLIMGTHCPASATVGRVASRFSSVRRDDRLPRNGGVWGTEFDHSSKQRVITTCGAGIYSPILKGARKLSLVVIRRGGKVLLGRKTHGFGEGIYQGFGGRVLSYEDFDLGAYRLTWQRIGVLCRNLEKKGIVWFLYEDGSKSKEIHVYVDKGPIDGTESEGDDFQPFWFDESEIPYEEMWKGDSKWLPVLLKDRCFQGVFCFERSGAIDFTKFSLVESDTLDLKFVEAPDLDNDDKLIP